MSKAMRAVLLVFLGSFVIATPSVWAYWAQDGVALCTAAGSQTKSALVSDAAGGVIAVWEDLRSGTADIYAQRANAAGFTQWTTNGVALCTAAGDQQYPKMVTDGAGGAIIAWYDSRNGGSNTDIYAQRVSASGAVQWAANGVPICAAALNQLSPTIVSDGAGGAIVAWVDSRSGSNAIYAQRVDAAGSALWTPDGVALCTAIGDKYYPMIASDGAGGAIVTWYDTRSGNYDIYAQRVDASGVVPWTPDGVAICTATNAQTSPQITSDGNGGAVVTWPDLRTGVDQDIYAQRVNASGEVQWTPDGVALCTATRDQFMPMIASDGAGGAIVTWYDYRSGVDNDIYIRRVDASGTVLWTANGVALCTATASQQEAAIVSDDAAGAIVVWRDARSGNADIYAQGVNATGTPRWTTNGIALCAATNTQQSAAIASDGNGEAIVTWSDYRSGNNDIYAQSVDRYGRIGYMAPRILSVSDVPGDQGGWVRISLGKSGYDDALESVLPVSLYNVWQRVDDPALLSALARESVEGTSDARIDEATSESSSDASKVSIWPLRELNGRCFVQPRELLGVGAFPSGTWELVGSFGACQQDQYIYRAGTLADSTADDISYAVYVVSAHTTTPSIWYMCEPDSGYSVDNLPPGAPGGLMAEQRFAPEGLALAWDVNPANDLSHYAVYRGSSEDFTPEAGNRVATPATPEYFDGDWRWSAGYYYKISAIDVHGNESDFTLSRPENVTGTDTPKAPEASYLSQNYPNPFNPVTKMAFGLSAPGPVSLRIYDAAGRLVRVLVEGSRAAGHYTEIWDGRDERGRGVSSGVYFYRLEGGTFTRTKKMVLLR